jgi:hypothetical protein
MCSFGGVIALAVATIAVPVQAQTTWYVDDDNCPGPGSGTSGDPFCSIQSAIEASVDGDEVIVAPGTYYESILLHGRAITIRSADGPAVTTIDGTGIADAVVVGLHNAGPDTVLRGFTITGGTGYDVPNNPASGGGMYLKGSDPTIVDCVFTGNTAGRGGGLFAEFSSVTLIGCTFFANAGGTGGAIRFDFSFGTPTLDGCTLVENEADLSGGGIFASEVVVILTDTKICGNESDFGGAIAQDNAECKLTRCRITGNSATIVGGGVLSTLGSELEMLSCVISYNSSS